VPPTAVQAALRSLFVTWGRPARMRVDNGWPWSAAGDLPAALALWLIGLGIEVIFNHPRRPQENGMVERFHGLIGPWAEPARCPSYAAWQERLAWLTRLQRERYPALGGQSRLAAWPSLTRVVRPYDPRREAAQWDLHRVTAYLAQGVWPRRVDQVGRITLYHRPYGVGRAYRGQTVFVRFDPTAHAWVIQDPAGQELRRHPALELTAERITRLAVSHLRPSPAHPAAKAAKPRGRHTQEA
jgi:hypothetical protein